MKEIIRAIRTLSKNKELFSSGDGSTLKYIELTGRGIMGQANNLVSVYNKGTMYDGSNPFYESANHLKDYVDRLITSKEEVPSVFSEIFDIVDYSGFISETLKTALYHKIHQECKVTLYGIYIYLYKQGKSHIKIKWNDKTEMAFDLGNIGITPHMSLLQARAHYRTFLYSSEQYGGDSKFKTYKQLFEHIASISKTKDQEETDRAHDRVIKLSMACIKQACQDSKKHLNTPLRIAAMKDCLKEQLKLLDNLTS